MKRGEGEESGVEYVSERVCCVRVCMNSVCVCRVEEQRAKMEGEEERQRGSGRDHASRSVCV